MKRDLRPMLAMAERHDIICGSRSSGEESVARRFGSWVFNLLTRLLLGIPVHNVHGPLKLYRREALLELLPAAHGNLASVELLHRAGEAGLRIGEVSLSGSSTPARAAART